MSEKSKTPDGADVSWEVFPYDLDFTKSGERKEYICPFVHRNCRMVRWALASAICLSVFLAILLSVGLVRTVKLFITLS